MRGFRFRSRVGMRGGSHACLVGEETAGNTVADRLTHCDSGTCTKNRLRIKRALQDRKERCRESRDVHADQDQAANEAFVDWVANFARENNMEITMTISADPATASEGMKKYL